MPRSTFALMLAMVIPACFALQACDKGPAEKAGEKVDKAIGAEPDNPLKKGPGQKAGEGVDDATWQ